ncbi:hypothetical protein ECG_02775 [Echinococcus granulosus]|uniref:DUF4200 domain-containing protein n=1 Tax=Echinococcus granulosus TaxID=6210 RepID=A0A068WP98_ECHGR|nr:hypothetical protein ECG_02775 [Echinococcus granulosus]CDS20264.1 hypothetical protein EgrG_000247500 [Echinococcus granulosus]
MFYNSPEGSHSDSLVDLIVHQKGATASICEKGTAGLTSLSDMVKVNKCNTSMRSAMLTHKLMNELQAEAMKSFVTTMKSQQERRKHLDQQTQEFEARRSTFRQIIIENMNKINRQYEIFKAMRSKYAQYYISKSHDPLRSLMLRYQSLIDARKHLLKEWEEKQIRLEEELLQSTTASRNQKQVVIEKVANVHDVLDEADGLRDRIHHFDKTIDREKTCITLQLNEFNLMSRSIRNITAKCVNMLKDLEYHQPLPAPPEKTRLCDCLQLIEFLYTIVEGIKKELIASESVNKKVRRTKN